MRFAGAIIKYSKRAITQLNSAAKGQGLPEKFLRCPYQAKVMKTLLQHDMKDKIYDFTRH